MPELRRRNRGLVSNYKEASPSSPSASDDEEENVQRVRVEKRKAAPSNDGEGADVQGGNRKKPRAAPGTKAKHNLTLFDIVCKHPTSINTACKEWMARYKANKAKGAAEIITLLVKACGSDMDVTADDLEEGDVDDVVSAIARKVMQDGGADPFKSKQLRNFKVHYLHMWDKLVCEVHVSDLLFDGYLMERVKDMVIALSCNVVRPFRYAATLTACQLFNTWIRLLLSLTEARDTAQYQLTAEEKKKSSKSSDERVQSLKRTVDRCHRRVTELKDLINSTFQSVFAHRFRDVSEEIRGEVIGGIGLWIKKMPSMFLNDSYLKYLAWALSDKDAVVRRVAVRSLISLYEDKDHVAPMHEFTVRFTPRFQELVFDVDEEVVVLGVGLLSLLVQLEELQPSAVRDVYRLLAEESPAMRHAAADLVLQLLEGEEAGGQASTPAAKLKSPAKGGRGRSKTTVPVVSSSPEVQLKGLLTMSRMLQSGGEVLEEEEAQDRRRSLGALPPIPLSYEVVEGLVDAMFDRLDVLHDWKYLTDVLLEDQPTSLGDDGSEQEHLVLVLAAAIHRAVKGSGDSAGGGGRRNKAVDPQVVESLTLVMMKALPEIIRKYRANGAVVGPLLSVPRYMRLETYTLKQEEAGYEALLQLIADVFFKNDHPDVLQQCAETLVGCSKTAPPGLQDISRVVLKETTQKALTQLVGAVKRAQGLSKAELRSAVVLMEQDPLKAPEAMYHLHLALQRVHILLTKGAASLAEESSLFPSCEQLAKSLVQGRCLSSATTKLLLNIMHLSLLWRLRTLATGAQPLAPAGSRAEGSRAGAGPSETGLFVLLKHRDSLLDILEKLLEDDEQYDEQVHIHAYNVVTELLFMFGSPQWQGTRLEPVRATANDTLVELCWQQCSRMMEGAKDDEEKSEAKGDLELQEEIDEEEEEQRSQQAAEQRARMKMRLDALSRLARMVAVDCLGKRGIDIAAKLLSLMADHGDQVCQVVKEMANMIRKNKQSHLAHIYLEALKEVYSSCLETDTDDDQAALIQRFSRLGKALSGMFVGSATARATLLETVQLGIEYGLQDPPHGFNFLAWGLGHFTGKIPAEEARGLVTQLEEASENLGQSQGDANAWEPFQQYLQGLRDRANKGRLARSALKHDKVVTQGRGRRRISFMGTERGGRNEEAADEDEQVYQGLLEEEEEEVQEDAEEQDAQPGAGPEAAGPSTSRGKTRLPVAPISPAPTGSPRPFSGFRRSARKTKSTRMPDLMSIGNSDEDEEEEGDEHHPPPGGRGNAVMPTEEQLPGHAGLAHDSGESDEDITQNVEEQEEEEEEEEEQEDMEDEEEEEEPHEQANDLAAHSDEDEEEEQAQAAALEPVIDEEPEEMEEPPARRKRRRRH